MAATILPRRMPGDAIVFGDPHLHTDGEPLALSFASDGTLWSVAETGLVQQWNVHAGKLVLSHSLSDLETLWCFSPDARLLASASDDVSIWDPRSGRLLSVMPQESWVTAISFHPNKAVVATGHDDGSVQIWDINQQRVLHKIAYHVEPISAVAFSPRAKWLACAGEDKAISIWEVDGYKHKGDLTGRIGHKDRIPALAWHPDDDVLVSAGWDTTARVWDIPAMEPIILLNSHATQVWTLAFSPDGQLLACADSNRKIHIWRFADKKPVHVLDGGDHEFRQLAFSPDGKQLAGGAAGVIRIWDVQKGEELTRSSSQIGIRVCMALSPDGKHLATSAGDCLQIWDTQNGASVQQLKETPPIHTLAYSPDGRWLADGTDEYIRLWEVSTGQSVGTCDGPYEPITCLAFSPDSKTLASGSAVGLAVWLWRVEDGEPILLIPDPLQGCTTEALAFHPGGRLLAVGGIDQLATAGSTGAVALWDIVDRCEIVTFPGGTRCLAFSPTNPDLLASGTMEDSICIWNIKTQEMVAELMGHNEMVQALAFTPDGRWLLSGGDDCSVYVWDTTNWTEKMVWEMDHPIKLLAVSPDGKFLFTGNSNAVSYRWELAPLLAKS